MPCCICHDMCISCVSVWCCVCDFVVYVMYLYISDSDADSDSEFIYSAIYHTITIFNYIKFQTNGPRRPPLRQNNVTGMGHLDEISICTCLHNILHIHVHIHNNIRLVKKTNNHVYVCLCAILCFMLCIFVKGRPATQPFL